MSLERVASAGVAVPPEARAFQGHRAGVVTRTAANLIDAAVTMSAVFGGFLVWCAVRFLIRPASFTFPTLSMIAALCCCGAFLFVYFAASWATTGQTYGDHLLGLRVVGRRGERMGWSAAVARSAMCVVLPIGLYWALMSSTNRSLQDTLLRTSVLYDWTGRRSGSERGAAVRSRPLPAPGSRGAGSR